MQFYSLHCQTVQSQCLVHGLYYHILAASSSHVDVAVLGFIASIQLWINEKHSVVNLCRTFWWFKVTVTID